MDAVMTDSLSFLGSVFASVLSFLIGLLANRAYDQLRVAELVVEEDPDDPTVGRPSQGAYGFFHVSVVPRARSRLFGGRPPQGVRAFVTITDPKDPEFRIHKPARWVSWSEPTSMTVVRDETGEYRPLKYVDPKELARQQTMDFRRLGQRERLDIALKIEGQDQMYFWNNENYAHGGQYDNHRLDTGDFEIRITLEYEGGEKSSSFVLSNRGNSWKHVRLRSSGV